jgi:hypothetical protein
MRSMILMVLISFFCCVSATLAQTSTPEERKARAMVEVLKEHKDKQEARQLESEKDAIRAQMYSDKSTPVSGTWLTIFTVVSVALLYWMFYRPDVNGWKIPFVGGKEEDLFMKWEKERKDRVSAALGSLSSTDVGKMTVADICKCNSSTVDDVEYALRERGWVAADYDGPAVKERYRKIHERTRARADKVG